MIDEHVESLEYVGFAKSDEAGREAQALAQAG